MFTTDGFGIALHSVASGAAHKLVLVQNFRALDSHVLHRSSDTSDTQTNGQVLVSVAANEINDKHRGQHSRHTVHIVLSWYLTSTLAPPCYLCWHKTMSWYAVTTTQIHK